MTVVDRSPWDVAVDLLFPEPAADLDDVQHLAGSLRDFMRTSWPLVLPNVPFVSSWHIDVVCEHLEAVSAGELRRLVINQPPRTTKSYTACVFWPAWEWLTNPSVQWLFASYAEKLALRDSVRCRRLIQSPGGKADGNVMQRLGYGGLLALLRDEPWYLTGDQNAKEKYENTEGGARMATGVGGLATGEGGDRIVVDDPVNAKQARSELERQNANTWWDETMTTRFNNTEAAAVIVMQRLHEDDLTGHLLAHGGWHHLCLPAEYEPAHPFVYPAKVKLASGRTVAGDPRTSAGELLEPGRLPRERLAELATALGSYGYAGQMQQRPSPAEGGMFKRAWWQHWTHDDPDSESGLPLDWMWSWRVASWDMRFASHDKAASSYVVGQVWGAYRADRYLLAQIRGHLSFTETVKAVLALNEFVPVNATLIERKANGEAVMNTLRRRVAGMLPIEPEGGKDVRGAAVTPTVEAGNVWLPASETIPCPSGYAATSVQDFVEEHATFPNGTHDDQVDAMTQAITWLAVRGGAASDRPIGAQHDKAGASITGDLLDPDAF